MTEKNSLEGNSAMNSHDTNENEELQIHTSTQSEPNEFVRNFIAPLTRQLKDVTGLIQGLSVTSHPNLYSRVDTDAS